MNLNNTIRATASLDSRRVAGGTYCKIINSIKILTLLKKYNCVPIYTTINPTTGYDVKSGLAFVVPNHSISTLVQLENSLLTLSTEQLALSKALKEKNKSSELSSDDVAKISATIQESERTILDQLNNIILIVRLKYDAVLGIPDARLHDVFIETQEVMPPEAYIVSKSTIYQDKNIVKEITPR
jgi:hypothetical protein